MGVIKARNAPGHQVGEYRFGPMPAHPAADGAARKPAIEPIVAADAAPPANVRKDRDRISELEGQLKALRDKAEKDVEAALEKGRKQGAQDTLKLDRERFEALENSLETALAAAQHHLETKAQFAIDIARTLVRRILGDDGKYRQLIEQAAATCKAELSDTAILEVRVSRADFPEPDQIRSLADRLVHTRIDVRDDLDPGACLFQLELGTVDASLPTQAANADALLARHGRGAGSA